MITIIKYILILLMTAYPIIGAQRLWIVTPEHNALTYWKNFDFDTAIIDGTFITPTHTSPQFEKLKELIRGIPKNTQAKQQEDKLELIDCLEPHRYASHIMTAESNGIHVILPFKKQDKRGYFVAEILKKNTVFSPQTEAISADILKYINTGIFTEDKIFVYTQTEP